MKRFILIACLLQAMFTTVTYAQAPIEHNILQIYGNEEGAALLNGGDSWQTVTKGSYLTIEQLLSGSLNPGYVRQYYILIARSDNMTCGEIQFRFWFSWKNKAGHQFKVTKWNGKMHEGGYALVQIPGTAAQALAAGIANTDPYGGYWRIDARVSGCDAVPSAAAKIAGIYLRAIDYYQGKDTAVVLNTDGDAAIPTRYVLGGTTGAVVVKDGKVGIGTFNPKASLSVNGEVYAKRVKVTQNAADWPDYVFHPDYKLPSLDSTAAFISNNRHLPGMPSAQQIGENGLDLAEMNRLLLQKVEELTLHMIRSQEENKALKARVEQLEKRLISPEKQKNGKR
nr:hypothetical protein [uncultured Chitinophaga sp.]